MMRKSHSASVCRCIWACLLLLALTVFFFQQSADHDALQLDDSEADSELNSEANSETNSELNLELNSEANLELNSEANSLARSKKLEIYKEDEEEQHQEDQILQLPRDADQDDDDYQGSRLYIYDLPAEFNTQILNLCDSYEPWTNFYEHLKNEGFGPKTHRCS